MNICSGREILGWSPVYGALASTWSCPDVGNLALVCPQVECSVPKPHQKKKKYVKPSSSLLKAQLEMWDLRSGLGKM